MRGLICILLLVIVIPSQAILYGKSGLYSYYSYHHKNLFTDFLEVTFDDWCINEVALNFQLLPKFIIHLLYIAIS